MTPRRRWQPRVTRFARPRGTRAALRPDTVVRRGPPIPRIPPATRRRRLGWAARRSSAPAAPTGRLAARSPSARLPAPAASAAHPAATGRIARKARRRHRRAARRLPHGLLAGGAAGRPGRRTGAAAGAIDARPARHTRPAVTRRPGVAAEHGGASRIARHAGHRGRVRGRVQHRAHQADPGAARRRRTVAAARARRLVADHRRRLGRRRRRLGAGGQRLHRPAGPRRRRGQRVGADRRHQLLPAPAGGGLHARAQPPDAVLPGLRAPRLAPSRIWETIAERRPGPEGSGLAGSLRGFVLMALPPHARSGPNPTKEE